ncbi:MAG: hypothetical protein J6V98_02815 [Bacteroidales bacterium]|nr:hypothetical protein [Bacteroidales bacterium]
MKKKALILLLAITALSLAACHKTCVCLGYDQLEHEFSEEQVDAIDGNCSNMRNHPVPNHYSVCNWE